MDIVSNFYIIHAFVHRLVLPSPPTLAREALVNGGQQLMQSLRTGQSAQLQEGHLCQPSVQAGEQHGRWGRECRSWRMDRCAVCGHDMALVFICSLHSYSYQQR